MKKQQINNQTLLLKESNKKKIKDIVQNIQVDTPNIYNKYMKKGFNKNLNSFNLNKLNDHSKKHFPSATKEWYNSIYTYNKKDMRNIVLKYMIVTKTIKKLIGSIPIYLRTQLSNSEWNSRVNRVYMSKPELKHNSSSVIITLYIFANHKINLTYFYKYLNKENFILWIKKETKIFEIKNIIDKKLKSLESSSIKEKKITMLYNNILIKILNLEKKIEKMKKYFEYRISRYFNKKVIIKFIRLKYLYLNSNMVSEYIALKLKWNNLYNARKILWHTKTPIYSKVPLNKKKNINKNTLKIKVLLNDISKLPLDMVNDKYYNKYINNRKLLTNNYCKEIIKLIKYKYPVGIRLSSAGRLTRRYRADRAVYKWFSTGIFNNIDSSINRQSVVLLRGCIRPNLSYSMYCFKRRIGAYSAKSWLSFF